MNFNPLALNNGIPDTLPLSGSSTFASYISSVINTTSSGITSSSFTTFDNSPAFTFTPTITGNYRVYSNIPIEMTVLNGECISRIFNTSGSAVLLAESQGFTYSDGAAVVQTTTVQSIYTLTAGVTYVFDIQGEVANSVGSILNRGDVAQFYMFAEGLALGSLSASNFYASSQVTSQDAGVTNTSFTTVSNSPAFTITPNISGIYKIYSSIPLFSPYQGTVAAARIFNTSGGGTLLYESQGAVEAITTGTAFNLLSSAEVQSVYQLTAATTYVFDIQTQSSSGNAVYVNGNSAAFYMFGELTAGVTTGGGSGSVTSVALSDASTTPIFAITGSPVTSTGTLTETLINQSANAVFAGPTSGSATQPTFRPLVLADLPSQSNSSVYASYTSSIVNTTSSTVTSGTFVTASNSPAFTFTPTVTGNYKVYSSIPLDNNSGGGEAIARIFNTSGGATLLAESQGITYSNVADIATSTYIQSTYTLIAGTTYIFDFQIRAGSGSAVVDGGIAPFYMFAEGIALSAPTQGSSVGAVLAMAGSPALGSGAIVPYDTVVFDTNSAYNIGTSTYTIPYTGMYEITATGTMTVSSNLILVKNSSEIFLLCTLFSGQCSSGSISILCNAADTIQILSTTAGTVDGSSSPYQNYLSIAQIPTPNLDRTITIKARAAGGESPGALNPIIFPLVYDTASGFNSGTGQYTVQPGYAGYWRIGGTFQISGANPGNVAVYINGTFSDYLCTTGDAVIGLLVSGWTETFLNAGDIITWTIDSADTFDAGSYYIATRIGS